MGIHRFKHEEGRDRQQPMMMYYQWTTGKDFHFQSQTTIGGHYTKWAPNVDPMGVISSELKSHFFNAVFVGNLDFGRLPVGSSISKNESFSDFPEPHLSPHLNYLALMGADWKGFSLSVGPYYPSFILTIGGETREVLSTGTSPMIRFQYTKRRWGLRALYSQTDYDYPAANLEEHLNGHGPVYDDGAENETFGAVSFKNRLLRVGFDYELNDDTTVGIDEVIMKGEYKESVGVWTNSVDFSHLYTSAYAERDLGHYVFLRLVGNFYSFKYDYKMGEKKDSTSDTLFKLGVVFGLLF